MIARERAPARRRIPKQARARERVERILEGARRELEERPIGEITIEGIAERAGVGAASVYSYFESKTALLVAVAERVMDATDAETARQLEACQRLPWREAVDQTVAGTFAVLRTAPSYRKLLRSIRFTAEFAERTAASNERVAALMAGHPAFARAGLSRARALAICRTLTTASNALQDRALADPRPDWRGLVSETQRLVKGYLGTYLR